MELQRRKVEIEFITELLGTVPKNKEIYGDYILKKAQDRGIEVDVQDELETMDEMLEVGWTGFHKDQDGLFLYDYLVKGNIKANIETLIMSKTINKIPAYKSACDRVVFIYPRHLHFLQDADIMIEPSGVLERPIRVIVAKGPRVGLVKSDFIYVGAKIRFQVAILPNPKISWELVEKAFDYGEYYGLGQWRGSGGYGRYRWKYIE